ncbi:MAG: alkaline phosphatase family protein [Solirubrobacterales bacterium]|nr:alkaline phosphatase family protein [Solirubrobacterales bacterium]
MARKLVLAYVDSLRTDMLEATIAAGRAPTLSRLVKRGTLVRDCVSSFPSVTPVASAEMVTGVASDQHWIPGMNWYHRTERRYVEYGSSIAATRAFGFFRSLHDLVYNMNLAHLSPAVETVFESLDDRGLDTASTPFLIYRGRHRHDVTLAGLTGKAVEAGLLKFHYGTWGPKELFYGDLYSSMEIPCKGTNVPGRRDPYSACCAAELIARDRFDFLLLSFPDNDNYSHRKGPEASGDSIERVDLCMAEVVRAAGGTEKFLAEYALVLLADHAHTAVDSELDLISWMAERWRVLGPSDDRPERAELAVSPTSRAAGIYLLEESTNRTSLAALHRQVREHAASLDGVELTVWIEDADGSPVVSGPGRTAPVPAGSSVVVSRYGRRFAFRPSPVSGRRRKRATPDHETVADRRGNEWEITGNQEALEALVEDGVIRTPVYPDALARLWAAARSPHSGEILISVAPGFECVDWGGVTHVPGGSHGSLRREDSEGPLLFCGCGPDLPDSTRSAAEPWALRDVAGVIREFFSA